MGDPRYQIDVSEHVFELAHRRARQRWPTTSAWLRHLLRSWDGIPLTPRSRRTKQLSVRLDAEDEARIERIARVSNTSLSEAFALLVERALFNGQEAGANDLADAPAEPGQGLDGGDAADEPAAPVIPDSADHERWAELVLQAARRTPHKYGDRKAFISGVLDELVNQLQPADPETLRSMVRRLLPELNRRDLIALSRADLPASMPPELVRDSAVRYLNATFHFVDLDHPPTR